MSIGDKFNLSDMDMFKTFFTAKKWAYSSYTPLSYFMRSAPTLDYSQIKRKVKQ